MADVNKNSFFPLHLKNKLNILNHLPLCEENRVTRINIFRKQDHTQMLAQQQPIPTSDRTFTRVARQRKVSQVADVLKDEKKVPMDEPFFLTGSRNENKLNCVQQQPLQITATSTPSCSTTLTTSTTSTKTEKEIEDIVDSVLEEFVRQQQEAVVESVEDDATNESESVEEVQSENVFLDQHNARGMRMTEPIPKGCIPNLDRPEPFYSDSIPAEVLEHIKVLTGLDTLKLGTEDLRAKRVPVDWMKLCMDALNYIIIEKWKPGIDSFDKLSETFRAVYATFFLECYDANKKMVNHKTVACVAHLLRILPTSECYNIEVTPQNDPLTRSFGIKEYQLTNWEPKDEHVLRMAAVSQISGDSLNAVSTLDMLMRFKRLTPLKNMCITTNEKMLNNQAFIFIGHLGDEGRITYSWVQIGLNHDTVAQLKKDQKAGIVQVHYDGPYCSNCLAHHLPHALIYCKTCQMTQYCSKQCMKKNKAKHNKICQPCG